MYGQYFLRKLHQFHSLNDLVYLYKRNNWIFDFNRFLKNYQNIKIEKPIFLLGTQGGGLKEHQEIINENCREYIERLNYQLMN